MKGTHLAAVRVADAAEEELKLLFRGDAVGLGRGSCGRHVELGLFLLESSCKKDEGCVDVSENPLVSCDLGLGRVLGKMIAWESGNGG